MATEARLPRIDFSGVDPSSPGAGRWAAVRAQVVDALATLGCFDAHYPALTPDLRAAFFDGAVKELFALPADAKRRNTYGPDKPLFGYLGGMPGLSNDYESLAISERVEPQSSSAPSPTSCGPTQTTPASGTQTERTTASEVVHGAARRMAELEEAVQRMVMEGLGGGKVPWRDEGVDAARVPDGSEVIRHGTHQDCSMLTVICQHGEVDGLEVQTGDGQWVRYKPSSPASLVVMAGKELRAWTNDRVRAPFHRVVVGGDVARYVAILFALPGLRIQAPAELPHCNDDFMRFCIAQGARHEDKLRDFCGV
ncbi:hypothetical protein HU200_045180 [Digitaria exilis]|uniref:Isopenicillin N synthase-like Fe(2+) 2OG dioxygenase domain-containing protein n=1 Tax=Digitaria exilis TaxID=1010633 RepID=A0A835EAB4_9POAL|nr:hypothetical protein HU200_045180 [Digitaria exilis]CAB3498823.1 unnamed protein product [Digitaria exilis]